jgi:hypothetical protein
LLGRGVTKDNEDRETIWVIPGVYGDPNTHLPVLVGGKTVQNQTRVSTNDLYFGGSFAINATDEYNTWDATVYRLREVTLGFNLPKAVTSKLKIGEATLSLSGRNLWFLAPNTPKYIHYDPEVNAYGSSSGIQGIELDSGPTTKRIGVNLNITF